MTFNAFADLKITLPPMPIGFEDASYHNDLCPSFARDANTDEEVRIWIDADRPEDREDPMCRRYTVATGPYGDVDNTSVLYSGDDWIAALTAIGKHDAKGAK